MLRVPGPHCWHPARSHGRLGLAPLLAAAQAPKGLRRHGSTTHRCQARGRAPPALLSALAGISSRPRTHRFHPRCPKPQVRWELTP